MLLCVRCFMCVYVRVRYSVCEREIMRVCMLLCVCEREVCVCARRGMLLCVLHQGVKPSGKTDNSRDLQHL